MSVFAPLPSLLKLVKNNIVLLHWIDGELEYYAELVLNVRKRKNTTQYLMKWYGYDDTYNSWSDLKDVVNSGS